MAAYAVASVVIAAAVAVLVITAAFLPVLAAIRPNQGRVTHAPDDVLDTCAFGTKVFIRESVQVERGDGKWLRGSMGAVAQGRTAER